MKIEKATAMGLSTGGGFASYPYLAQNFPYFVKAVFLVHSIPLRKLIYSTVNNDLVVRKRAVKRFDQVQFYAEKGS